ncbi:MAG: HIT family protein [Pseudomonadota bacterium]|nr:HIT family protein [Pseudomonadota bacterium]
MPHATLVKFGYPATLLREYEHWCVLVRPAQATLGALVLAAKSEATAFSALGTAAFSELGRAVGDIEASLQKFRAFERINYLMLMMVDPHVHFHVLPRYGTVQTFDGIDFEDRGWPAAPDLKHSTALTKTQFAALFAAIKSVWP